MLLGIVADIVPAEVFHVRNETCARITRRHHYRRPREVFLEFIEFVEQMWMVEDNSRLEQIGRVTVKLATARRSRNGSLES